MGKSQSRLTRVVKEGRSRIPMGERKRAPVLVRVSAEMRSAIEAESDRTGRSLSAVAELWLEQARVLHRLHVVKPGGITDYGTRKRPGKCPDVQAHFEGF